METQIAFDNMQKYTNKLVTADDICNCFNDAGNVEFNELYSIGTNIKIYEVYDQDEYENSGTKIEIVVKQGRLIQIILK